MGIVCGANQWLIKLEIPDQPSDEMIEYLDGILSEPQGGEAVYDLPGPGDPIYQMELVDLELMWTQTKAEIAASRSESGGSTKPLTLSEDFSEQANRTVFSADTYSAR